MDLSNKKDNDIAELNNIYKEFPDSIANITRETLLDLFLDTDDFGKNNLFFILLNEYYSLQKNGSNDKLAHTCYLISYFLLNILVPLKSRELSIVFANKAYEYINTIEYADWLEFVKEEYKRTC